MTERLRGRALQLRRARWFRLHPLCVKCEAQRKLAKAVELDHIVPLHKGGADDGSNLQGLCKACHQAKTDADLGHRSRARIGLDGWPVPG